MKWPNKAIEMYDESATTSHGRSYLFWESLSVMPSESNSDYDAFAWLYNRQWGRLAKAFVPDLESRVLCHLPENASILDLCCGTGDLAAILSERAYSVTGIDSSEGMLEFARKNAPEADFVLADARSFSMPPRFHAVLSLFDSLNHIMKIDELQSVFRNVFRALSTPGLFFFDLNMERGFIERWQGKSFSIIEDDLVCANRTFYDTETRTGKAHFAIFRSGDHWNRNDVILYQKCFSDEEVVKALERAGFKDIRALDAAREMKFKDIGRTFFLAKKEATKR